MFLEGRWKEARDKKRELQNHRRLSSSQNFHAAARPSSAGHSLPADCLQNVITEKWLCNTVESLAWIKRLCCVDAGEICKGYGNHADSGEAMCELDSPINRTRIAEMSHQKSNIAKMIFTLSLLSSALMGLTAALPYYPTGSSYRLDYVIMIQRVC